MYNNPGPGSDDSFADAEMPESQAKPQEQEEKSEDGPTALLPKSILAGKDFKPGEEVVLKIVAMHDDQVEVAYSYGDKGEGKEEAAESPKAGSAHGDEMSSYME